MGIGSEQAKQFQEMLEMVTSGMDKGFRQYVSKEADYLFDNIKKYWGVLLSK